MEASTDDRRPGMMTARPPLLERPVEHLLAHLQTAVPRWIVGMAGVPGAGKSTLAARLAADVNRRAGPSTLVALGMDGFHLTKAELRSFPNPAEAIARRGAPWTFDSRALWQRLQLLRTGAGRIDVTWPGFEHDVGDPVEAASTIPASTRLVLVEGLYLLHQADGWEALRPLFDERWYLDTPVETALDRLALRHTQVWGMTREEADRRVASNDRPNAAIVMASSTFADWYVEPERYGGSARGAAR